jgi:acylphosphatase
MHLIIYISDYTGTDREIGRDLITIHKLSKKNNLALGITGVLFYHNGNFLQVLEGKKEHLEQLMNILKKDTRHTHITRIVDIEIPTRGFPDWNMDVFNLDAEVAIKRSDLTVYEKMFSTQCRMDSSVFIKMLKSLYEDVELYKIITE